MNIRQELKKIQNENVFEINRLCQYISVTLKCKTMPTCTTWIALKVIF